MINKPIYDELRTRVLKGSVILKFLDEIRFLVEEDRAWMGWSNDFIDMDPQFLKKREFETNASYSAYSKAFRFMNELFGIDRMKEKEFRRKTFKGYKIIQAMEFFEFCWKECDINIKMFKDMSENDYASFINFFEIQVDCYLTINHHLCGRFLKNYQPEEYSVIKKQIYNT
ncbi:hypothetical protein [Bacillus toyonensis]|uniref:hypothetical protein n=1 Tax=Bacillus toyonensis TaxID=155322 RepID=UPI000BF04C04|nr:hypothetical protein [Bacillus toyonensis]PEK30527.1 hypothetical protein CN897_27305 [Bacillus toyonensis]